MADTWLAEKREHCMFDRCPRARMVASRVCEPINDELEVIPKVKIVSCAVDQSSEGAFDKIVNSCFFGF